MDMLRRLISRRIIIIIIIIVNTVILVIKFVNKFFNFLEDIVCLTIFFCFLSFIYSLLCCIGDYFILIVNVIKMSCK